MSDVEIINEAIAMLLEFGYDLPEEICDLQCDLVEIELEKE